MMPRSTPSRLVAGLALFALLALTSGCAGEVQVREIVTPERARELRGSKFEPVAVLRDPKPRVPLESQTRVPIGRFAEIEKSRVVVPEVQGEARVELGPRDVIEMDDDGRIVSVRKAGPPETRVRFVPGSAYSPTGVPEVRGRLEGGSRVIALGARDRILVEGAFEPGDRVPGIGTIETSRWTFALVTGIIVFPTSYLPAAIVGAGSNRQEDRWLLAPVVGPWIDLAERSECVPPSVPPGALPIDPCAEEKANKFAIVASGIGQGVGAVLLALGLPSHAELVRDREGAPLPAQPTWMLQPRMGQNEQGLGIVGAF